MESVPFGGTYLIVVPLTATAAAPKPVPMGLLKRDEAAAPPPKSEDDEVDVVPLNSPPPAGAVDPKPKHNISINLAALFVSYQRKA